MPERTSAALSGPLARSNANLDAVSAHFRQFGRQALQSGLGVGRVQQDPQLEFGDPFAEYPVIRMRWPDCQRHSFRQCLVGCPRAAMRQGEAGMGEAVQPDHAARRDRPAVDMHGTAVDAQHVPCITGVDQPLDDPGRQVADAGGTQQHGEEVVQRLDLRRRCVVRGP